MLDTIADLERDMKGVIRKVPGDLKRTVREGARVGNDVARENARRSSGTHGKLYPKAFTSEARPPFRGFGTSIYSSEYGPDIAMPQGGMSFEGGSRNQPPHNDLAKSADLMGPALAGEVRRLPESWFW
jgi:hypothetical protein